MLTDHFHTLRAQFEDVLLIKNNPLNVEDLTDKRKFVSMLFVLIKKCSRNDKSNVKRGRDELCQKKNLVDNFRLQLQNLLYEINHLKKEIRNCYLFKSLDEDIDLLSKEDYSITSDNLPQNSHALRVLCLQSELNLRKQLHIDYYSLLNSKKHLYKDILLKIERHALFIPALKVLIKATIPLREALQISLSEEWELCELVNQLPKSLYLTFVNLHAIQHTSDLCLNVKVVESESPPESVISSREFDDSINDEAYCEKETSLQPSKLMIRITIRNEKDVENCLVLDIRYFDEIGFATISLSKLTENCNGESISQDILRFVAEKDFGDVVPIPDSEIKLKPFNLTTNECVKYLVNNGYGKPYVWLQKLCSIKVYNYSKHLDEKKLQKYMLDIIGKMKKLWYSQICILKQIKALTNKSFELYLQNNVFGYKPVCGLAQWALIKWQDYENENSTKSFTKSFFIDEHCDFYRAVLVRGSAKLECFVSILGKLCFNHPVWALCLHWNGEHTAANNAAIKEMECRVNSIIPNSNDTKHQILFNQLLITMMSLDIYLESACLPQHPQEFVSDNLSAKSIQRRTRCRSFILQNRKIPTNSNF